MKRTRTDSTLDVWSINWVNDPDIRKREGVEIEQIEAINECWFIVEIFKEGTKE